MLAERQEQQPQRTKRDPDGTSLEIKALRIKKSVDYESLSLYFSLLTTRFFLCACSPLRCRTCIMSNEVDAGARSGRAID